MTQNGVKINDVNIFRMYLMFKMNENEDLITFEFFYNLFSVESCQNPASIDRKEQNKKLLPVSIEPMASCTSL